MNKILPILIGFIILLWSATCYLGGQAVGFNNGYEAHKQVQKRLDDAFGK